MRLLPIIALIFASMITFADPAVLEKNQKLDPSSLGKYSLEELIILRNSVFARYGYIFKSGALNKYFSGFAWYRPDQCTDTYHFDTRGKLVLMYGNVKGTTVNHEYYYQYCLGSLAWIEVTLSSGSAGVKDISEKIFY